MEFRLTGTIDGFGLHPDGPEVISVPARGRRRVRVAMWTDRSTDRPRLLYRVLATFEPNPALRRMFEALAAGRYPPGSRTQDTLGRGLVHNAGRRIPRVAQLGLMPKSFETFAKGLGGQLEAAAVRALALLRWRSGELGAPLARPGRLFEWTLGDGRWHHAPTTITVTFDAYSYPQLSAAARADIVELYGQQVYEPFAYELIREASSQLTTSPRSALITAFTALEVAVKHFISERLPEAAWPAWLSEQEQSPDVISLLDDYLPELQSAGSGATHFIKLPDPLRGELFKLRNKRNIVTHRPDPYDRSSRGGAPVVTTEHAERAVLAVRDVLLRLDVANGYSWASEYLGHEKRPSAGYRKVR